MRTSTSKSRWTSATPRNWSGVMSPRRQWAYALTVPFARPRTTLASSHFAYGERPENSIGLPRSAATAGPIPAGAPEVGRARGPLAARRAPCLLPRGGDAARVRRRADEELPLLEDALAQ